MGEKQKLSGMKITKEYSIYIRYYYRFMITESERVGGCWQTPRGIKRLEALASRFKKMEDGG